MRSSGPGLNLALTSRSGLLVSLRVTRGGCVAGPGLFLLRVTRGGRVAGPGLFLAADQGDDFVRDAERRAADQLHGPGIPEDEADARQDRDRVDRPGVARLVGHRQPRHELV